MRPFLLFLLIPALCFGGACAPRPAPFLDAPAVLASVPAPAPVSALSPTLRKVLANADAQTRTTRTYDPAYVSLSYPNGDVPQERGVCADVIVRAFRAGGIDLQKTVHEDMTAHFAHYPKLWGLRRPDPNIDHRRVANLMTYFARRHQSVPASTDPSGYRPGDVVAWELPGGRLHTGMVSDRPVSGTNRYSMIHNVGAGTRLEDVLFGWKILGHYRCFR